MYVLEWILMLTVSWVFSHCDITFVRPAGKGSEADPSEGSWSWALFQA